MEFGEGSRLSRGQFLRAAAGGAATLLWSASEAAQAFGSPPVRRAGASGPAAGYIHSFHSRPDLKPPRAGLRRGPDASRHGRGGLWFLTAGTNAADTQGGPLVLDGRGRPVWFKPLPRVWFAQDLRPQNFLGEPVLTWWEGTVDGEIGEGVVMDTSYREIFRVRAANGHQVDPHEFLLTAEGTALITCSPSIVQADLSSVGGSRHGQVSESVIQEIDLQTGGLVLEWRSLEHVPVSESYMWPGHGVYDYMHANSIDVTPDGNLLVSGRHTWALYKLERSTGRVLWRLGGKRSDFEMKPGAQFAWQHDGRQVNERTITVFDDGAAFFVGKHRLRSTHRQSRGLTLSVDHGAGQVAVKHVYDHHPPLLAGGYGNMDTLTNGDVVVGWGNLPAFSQYAPDGTLVEELDLPYVYASYRAHRRPWVGAPDDTPAVAVRRRRGHPGVTVFVSWNGDTRCAAWRIRAGSQPHRLHHVSTHRRTGFETAIDLPVSGGYVEVTALDHRHRRLSRTSPVKI